jgi:hypothetical protein
MENEPMVQLAEVKELYEELLSYQAECIQRLERQGTQPLMAKEQLLRAWDGAAAHLRQDVDRSTHKSRSPLSPGATNGPAR